ncbi:metal-dependent hydrolase [Methanogenium sp. S4BF]|uniref:metal-dependent hydrolase n=1 Tax=Methanogenium sp. S4BF TaxID=1789226 RepID=UPI002416FA20|nr:metal-dependent hydrolase [Methanogenium sp. S4BF]WFN34054.1 metal-dependent hydrolase [Methanogenium sp. S4BF]
MLPAVHLLIGITLGIFLLYLTKDCRAVIYCSIGSLLPDIIDKPVGHLILATLGNGRIFFHSLTICGIVAFLGFIILIKWRHPGLLFIAAGMLSHQLADAMWAIPNSWYWPFLGWFRPKYMPFYFEDMFSLEFSSPSELLVIILGLILLICMVHAWRKGNIALFRRVAGVVGLILLIAGGLVLSTLAGFFCPSFCFVMQILPGFLVYSGFQDIFICGLALILGGGAFLLVSLSPPIGCGMKDFL